MNMVLELLDPVESIPFLEGYEFPPYITLAHVFNAPSDWRLPQRILSQHQLQYVLEGVARYSVEGVDYLTERGDLIYHGPNERHSVSLISGEPYVCLSVVFHFGAAKSSLQALISGRTYLGNFQGTLLEDLLSLLVTVYHQTGIHNQLLCQGVLLQVLAELFKNAENESFKANSDAKWKAKIVLIRNYLATHYSEPISHEHLEAVSGLSRNYIIVKFRELYGCTPFAYLTRVRIEHAKALAIQSNLSICEIAYHVGYPDVHSFGRMFKKNTGISLSQFISSLVSH